LLNAASLAFLVEYFCKLEEKALLVALVTNKSNGVLCNYCTVKGSWRDLKEKADIVPSGQVVACVGRIKRNILEYIVEIYKKIYCRNIFHRKLGTVYCLGRRLLRVWEGIRET